MRLTSIEARELFSFDRLNVRDLPARTLVVVGPNGAGKTNLIRLLEIGRAASERAANYSHEAYWTLARFGGGRRYGAVSGSGSGVRLGIALTEPWERELLVSFVRAAIASGILQGAPTNSDTGSLIAWIKAHVGAEELAPLTEGMLLADLVDEITGQWTLTYEFEAGGERYWWVLDGRPSPGVIVRAAPASAPGILTYHVDRKLDLDEKRVPRRPFALSDLLPPPGEGIELSVQSGPLPSTELVREFAACAGITIEQTQSRSFTFAQVVRVVLDRGLVLLGDLRQPPRVEYTVEEVGFDPVPTDGSRIPLRLFRLKNGDAGDRARYATAQELFTRLTGRRFHIALADSSPDPGSGSPSKLLISLVVDRDGRDLPIELAGGGIWEALLLSATLPDSAGRVAVLDEPARNLHPTLQRRLLTEMRRAPGQFILTTHSPYLVSIEDDSDLASILRFDVPNGITRANRLAQGGPPNASRLQKLLAESADARALLFARGVVWSRVGRSWGHCRSGSPRARQPTGWARQTPSTWSCSRSTATRTMGRLSASCAASASRGPSSAMAVFFGSEVADARSSSRCWQLRLTIQNSRMPQREVSPCPSLICERSEQDVVSSHWPRAGTRRQRASRRTPTRSRRDDLTRLHGSWGTAR